MLANTRDCFAHFISPEPAWRVVKVGRRFGGIVHINIDMQIDLVHFARELFQEWPEGASNAFGCGFPRRANW